MRSKQRAQQWLEFSHLMLTDSALLAIPIMMTLDGLLPRVVLRPLLIGGICISLIGVVAIAMARYHNDGS